MTTTHPDESATRAENLTTWHAFSLAYYEPIRRALRLLRVPEGDIDELANAFLIKAHEKNFLDAYRDFQHRARGEGWEPKFRKYLYRSLQHHVRDGHRQRTTRSHEEALSPLAAASLPAPDDLSLGLDALYALDILHQALQALRLHCERTGKPHVWLIFEELLLADEFRGREPMTRQRLLERFPGKTPQFLDNCLTTAKRVFRRLIQELIPQDPKDSETAAERFEDWMAILRESHASQFNKLHVAYRVTPYLALDESELGSSAFTPEGSALRSRYAEPAFETSDADEIGLLLSFRLELRLEETFAPETLHKFIPSDSPLWPNRPSRGAADEGELQASERRVCLLTFIDPTPEQADAFKTIDLEGLLGLIKRYAKLLPKRNDHALPHLFAHLLYTIVNVLALLRCESMIHTISRESMVGNIRWFLKEPWLDARLRPLFQEGLTRLEAPSKPEPSPEV